MWQFVLVTVLLLHTPSVYCDPTTPYIQDVFLGKCYIKNPTNFDCMGLWNAFSNAASLDRKENASKEWELFFDKASFASQENLTLFWSGSKAFSAFLSTGGKYISLEETPVGYVLNQLTWCGNTSNQFDYGAECSYSHNPGVNYGMEPIWRRASKEFALQASGDITILLNPAPVGDIYQAYRNFSIFATVEFDAMNVDNIKSISVLLLKNASWPDEQCGSGSLVTMIDQLRSKFGSNMSIECIDDPTVIVERICSDPHDTSAECIASRLMEKQNTQDLDFFQKHGQMFAVASVVLFVLVVLQIVIFVIMRIRRRGYSQIQSF